ncbi:MAG: VOC family protein [Promicromonosporaceae bacterium]|nr:VOC family protein [Promicromonosporaceae bacterium]
MLSTNLEFNGNAREAMEFYAKVFGHELQDADIWPGPDGQVAHGQFKIYGNDLMFTDVAHDVAGFSGFALSINLTDEAELRDRFEKMSDGAQVLIPIGKVEWSECYGLLRDRFGVAWQFNLD